MLQSIKGIYYQNIKLNASETQWCMNKYTATGKFNKRIYTGPVCQPAEQLSPLQAKKKQSTILMVHIDSYVGMASLTRINLQYVCDD